MIRADLYVLYELHLSSLILELTDGSQVDVSHALSNGRANYIMFEKLVGDLVGLEAGTQGGGSDLSDGAGNGYEVKAFKDAGLHPEPSADMFQTSASRTFGANNLGPKIKALLDEDQYEQALELCRETGYDKNDFYVYTNTRQFDPEVPLRFIILPTSDVLAGLSRDDPRLISRQHVLNAATQTTEVPEEWISGLEGIARGSEPETT